MTRAYRKPKTLMQRIEEKIHRQNGHWLWQGSKAWNGTGRIHIDVGVVPVGRVIYNQYKGEIPENLKIISSCRIPNCINPEHLIIVTHGQAQKLKGNMHKAGRPRKKEDDNAILR